MYCSEPHFVKNRINGKVIQVRCCEIPKETEDGDFDIIWQFFEDDKWNIDNNICSPDYNFHVEESEKKEVQLFINYF